MTEIDTPLSPDAARERAAILRWIMRYGDELNRAIGRTHDGPIKTAAMGEFSATVTIRQAIERGSHWTPRR